MKMRQLILSKEQKEELIDLHKSVGDKRIADRIKSVILFSDGYSKSEIEKILLIERRSIGKYIKRYLEKGIDSLLILNYRGSKSKLTKEEIALLKKELNEKLYSTAKEICDYVEKRFKKTYKVESMVKFLRRIGFSYKKTKSRPSKANREKQEVFVKEYEELRNNLKPDETIYFIDAVHPQHNSMPAYAWIEKGKEKEILSNSGRQRVNINGAYSPVNQEIITRQDDTINAQSTVALYKQLEKRNPNKSTIFVIRDNAKYYSAEVVKTFLKDSKIKEMPLPSYSPNLNLIERLWKFFKKKTLYNRYYSSFLEFKKAVDIFFEIAPTKYKNELSSLMTEKFHLFLES